MSYTSRADLGGQDGHGPVTPEPEGELFHAGWEPKALVLTLAAGATGMWNIDMSRRARETLANYAQLSYYQIWIAALEKLLAERRMVDADEIAAGRALHPPVAVPRVLRSADVPAVLAQGTPTARPEITAQRFHIGQTVQTHSGPIPHHTRLPGYARGKRGTIEQVHGVHVFADRHAQARGEMPQWLYTVVFDGNTLWGDGAAPGLRVSIDAWEPYLKAAP